MYRIVAYWAPLEILYARDTLARVPSFAEPEVGMSGFHQAYENIDLEKLIEGGCYGFK